MPARGEFSIGDIPFFDDYQFTDTGKSAKHFGLVLLPETSTEYEGSLLCCVITSKKPKRLKLVLDLQSSSYDFLSKDSYACFDRKDLVSMRGLENGKQPKGSLKKPDLQKAYRKLKKSLYVIKDLASEPYLRGTIIYQWKKKLGLLK